MARFNASIRPVHRIKHVVDVEGATVADTLSVIDVIDTVDAPTIATAQQCETGSKVNGIYLRVEALHSSGAGRSNMYMAVMKNPGNNVTNIPKPNAIGVSDAKNKFIHQEMIMLNGDAGNGQPRVLFNGVIKIPKGYIRNGPSDRLQVHLLTPTVASDWCLQCHYKEFR